MCDLAEEDWSNDNAVVWEYVHNSKGNNIAGVKFRDSEYYGGKVMIYCYSKGCRIVDYETKKTVWDAVGESRVGVNIHSAEILPDGTVITASSNDSLISVFAPGSTTPCQTLYFYSAHGVMWDPKYECVWIEGGNELSSFKVSYSGSNPVLTKEKTYNTPSSGLHDLAAEYGNPDRLLVTCSAGVMVFDKRTGKFDYSYSGGVIGKSKTYSPGCGVYASGVFVFTAVESDNKLAKDWWTNRVKFFVPIAEKKGVLIVREQPNDAYYKARIMDFNYQ